MIRTAYALGAWLTVALDGTADVRGPKVLRGSMGAAFRHPVVEATFDGVRGVRGGAPASRSGLAAADGEPADKLAPVAGSIALVVGNEGAGLREDWRRHEHRAISRADAARRGVAERRHRGAAFSCTRCPVRRR